MTDINDREAVEKRLWGEIEKLHLGMLGLVDGEAQHFQPMTPFIEEHAGKIWFFTRADTDLAQDLAAGGRQAMFIVQGGQRDLQACIGGEIRTQMDRARLERFWNPHVAAWYPDGKDDPKLVMLCMDCEEARVWVSEAGPVRYAYEVAKANMTRDVPDIGGSTDITLGR
ncbi:MAG TPA: pyridoxamine 5'-phosphate oxidase family protein [Caulobacteraceae bacterium]